MKIAKEVEELLNDAVLNAGKRGNEYVTPEHVWFVLADRPAFQAAFKSCGGDVKKLKSRLEEYLEQMDTVEKEEGGIEVSYGLSQTIEEAARKAISSDRDTIELPHLLYSMMELEESYGAYFVQMQGVECVDILVELGTDGSGRKMGAGAGGTSDMDNEEDAEEERESILLQYAVCINDEVKNSCPLIGREAELERTMQVLCRRQKNNPLHVGEPGVGKTAITYGLAARINEGRVPEKLKNARIYGIDLGSMLAGTQFRGDFEKRLKAVMEELKEEENPILYIDEIHNLVGAGAVNGGSMDASNLLKPYLTDGKLKFIGATTYEEYKKYFSKDKSLVRRFQNIDIKEPTVEETVEILNGLKPYYEKFHHVRYQKGTMEHAASLSEQYINERYLPDKAIDLIDEAGAYLELHPKNKKIQVVDKKLVEEVLAKICRIPKQTVETEERQKLARLERELKGRVFGQEAAVDQLTNAIKLSKAGLSEENKPVGSLLFVGPTGVGKTELAKSVAEVLGIRLVRFDMSEYAEKHTVAKLIGSPAGYVGYEEGGLLTEAIRKNPHCVLLLDEIEKAHSDIYNILLQIMDYATLTDNQGRKADFRSVILIMTSNAGAEKADRASIGFGGRQLNEEGITDEVKRVFRPEFRNRLDRIIIFRPLDAAMADRIVGKEFGNLARKAAEKNVELTLSRACRKYLAAKGVSREYGAREIKRIIGQEIKPLLVDEMLFGRLKKGGSCEIDYDGKRVILL
ncbi:ATP-dependent Clp protease ATP-binding subunit ClpA [Hungatella effluvii]|uniref:ATP-dependent Clp protease ATP-binding subunit ClpA n=1 Tax=Hungatella effluvii TaxID=1096246 RepID=A0A2V3YCK5_9FIRM|nr:ATP-dependent Clp protease ATP-binding subunit ClpA [Hungatella effluvii]PXX56866.1 ATP-dependent Clp protease ATP-binding subunit ClpA [Hungatella effluvii]